MIVEATIDWPYGFAAAGLVTVSAVLLMISRILRKFPPGPRGIPYFGVLFELSDHAERRYKKWSLEGYGPIMSVKLLGKRVVILNTYDVIKQVITSQLFTYYSRLKAFFMLDCLENTKNWKFFYARMAFNEIFPSTVCDLKWPNI